MKRLLTVLLAIVMMFTVSTFCTATKFDPSQSELPIDSFNPLYVSDESVFYYTSSEAKKFEDGTALKRAVANGKIIVVKTDTNTDLHESGAGELLGMSLSPANNDLSPLSTKSMDRGVDVAAIYYEYRENVLGTYIINIGSEDTVNVDILIDEAIAEIKARQNSPAFSVLSTTAAPDGTRLLNVFTFFATRLPKGQLSATYEFAVAPGYAGRNYFVVKATFDAYPGHVLSDTDSNYQRKYQCETLIATIGAGESSLWINDYGPKRDIETGSTSYTVDITSGLAAIMTSFAGFTGIPLQYSRYINHQDTTISVSGNTNLREWNVALTGGAQKAICTFEPAATFWCSSNKTTAIIDLSAVFEVDSWDTAIEGIPMDYTVTCTLTGATVN